MGKGGEKRGRGEGAREIEAFLRVLDPADNAVGGGTASAVAGAMAAALTAMVARLSVGKHGMEPESFYAPIIAEAEGLVRELMAGSRQDAQAFHGVMKAYRLHRATSEERVARQSAIQSALRHAALVPLANARRCRRVLELRQTLLGRSNANVASDLSCAGHLAAAGLRGCLENVRINLPALKDQDQVRAIVAEVEELERVLDPDP